MEHARDPRTPARPSWPRYLAVAAGLLIALGVLAVVLGPSLMVSYWIHGLNSDNPVEQRENERKLTESQVAGVEDKLLSTVRDEGEAFRVREAAARILYDRQQLVLLEGVLRDGSPHAKAVVVSELARRSHFVGDYARKEEWGVRDVLRTWLRDVDDTRRSRAVEIAYMEGVDLAEAMPEIRGMLVRRPSLPAEEQKLQLLAATAAAVKFRDCESAPGVAALAEGDPEPYVRLRAIQSVFDLADPAKGDCAAALPPERLEALVASGLSSPERLVRLGALSSLETRQPPWIPRLRDRLFEILDGDASQEERRSALSALALAKDETIRQRLPRYFHDRSPSVRSTAVGAVEGPLTDGGFDACLVGVVRFENENAIAFETALQVLRRRAHDWLGLPSDVRLDAAQRGPKFRTFLSELFTRGQSRGIDREAWAKEWFRWNAGQLGLSEEEIPRAVEAQDRFWRAARGADVAGARGALEAFPRKVPGLFCYEEGWLAARTGSPPP